jgi:predicted nucleic acid-binding protein
MRIRLETDAVQLILSYVRSGHFTLVVSPVHKIEVGAIKDQVEREHLLSTLRKIGHRIEVDLMRVRERAELLTGRGFGPADAAHLAFAEASGADFISCDDRLLRQSHHVQSSVWSGSPIAFCEKEKLQ